MKAKRLNQKMDFELPKMDIEHEIRQLQKRVTLIEMRRGKKLKQIANWLQSNFDSKHTKISVKKLRRLSNHDGYSWQMIQRARREILCDDIEPLQVKGVWYWTNDI